MNEFILESVWNGRFTDDSDDWPYELAKKSCNYSEFVFLVRKKMNEEFDYDFNY